MRGSMGMSKVLAKGLSETRVHKVTHTLASYFHAPQLFVYIFPHWYRSGLGIKNSQEHTIWNIYSASFASRMCLQSCVKPGGILSP